MNCGDSLYIYNSAESCVPVFAMPTGWYVPLPLKPFIVTGVFVGD
jgi:hypothetical protein